ncbi:N-acetylmuramoyl-L-alanine amidase [Enterococcus sp. LJL90]
MKKNTRLLRLKFNLFVTILCAATILLGYGFDRVFTANAESLLVTQAKTNDEEGTAEAEPVATKEMVKLQVTATEDSTAASSDSGVDNTDDTASYISVYTEADTASVIVEQVFTGEWADYIGQADGFIHIKTNAGNEGYILAENGAVQTVSDKSSNISLAGAVVVLDPGHGGNDAGAVSTNEQFYEKDLTLATAEVIKAALEEKGAMVFLTRSDDTYVSLDDRVQKGIDENADIFISLHYDSFDTANTMSGYTSYYYYENEEALAKDVNSGLTSSINALSNIGVRTENFEVIRETPYPSLLLELGYINTYADLLSITNEEYYDQVASGIVSGLEKYFQG